MTDTDEAFQTLFRTRYQELRNDPGTLSNVREYVRRNLKKALLDELQRAVESETDLEERSKINKTIDQIRKDGSHINPVPEQAHVSRILTLMALDDVRAHQQAVLDDQKRHEGAQESPIFTGPQGIIKPEDA